MGNQGNGAQASSGGRITPRVAAAVAALMSLSMKPSPLIWSGSTGPKPWNHLPQAVGMNSAIGTMTSVHSCSFVGNGALDRRADRSHGQCSSRRADDGHSRFRNDNGSRADPRAALDVFGLVGTVPASRAAAKAAFQVVGLRIDQEAFLEVRVGFARGDGVVAIRGWRWHAGLPGHFATTMIADPIKMKTPPSTTGSCSWPLKSSTENRATKSG